MSDLLGIGLSGLQAAQLGLTTTSHNIANVNTPGFSRQEIVQSTQIPLPTGAGWLGQGTTVDTIKRVFSDFLNRQVVNGEAQTAALDAFNAQIRQIDDLLADPTVGLSPSLQAFFGSVHDLANDPSTLVTRQALIGSAQGLADRLHTLDQRLGELRQGVNSQLATAVTEVNTIAGQIAQLNDHIALAELNPNQPANDLRDQRDQLVVELNRRIGATVVQQGNAYNVFIGNGVPIVVGKNAYAIGVVNSSTDPGRSVVGVVTPGGTVEIQEASLQGGMIGGLLAFRSQGVEPSQNALGRIAIVLADTFNAQHQLGQDLTGALGGNFFNVPAAPSVSASSHNTGSAVLAASFANTGALTTSDYQVEYTGANYVVTRLSDNTQTSGPLPVTVDGVTLTLASGTPNAGDRFLLRPTVNGASGISVAIVDGSRIAAAAPIRSARGAANTGTATISAGAVNSPPPPNANLQQTVTITFTSANTFDVAGVGTGNPTGVAYTSDAAITYNGWTVAISGAAAAGDTFTVSANSGGISDNRNALLLAALQTRSTVGNGTGTYQSAYGQLVSQVGNTTRQAEISLTAQQTFLDQSRQAQQSLSGVNLDEEAANLVRYQQAYQASARVIQVGKEIFADLLLALG